MQNPEPHAAICCSLMLCNPLLARICHTHPTGSGAQLQSTCMAMDGLRDGTDNVDTDEVAITRTAYDDA
jgi:hypothetical protein